MMSSFQAFDELWWFYLCRIQEKHRAFDKALALAKPAAALGRLESELLAHHPIYYRSIWFLAAVNLLVEAGESVDLADQRLVAVIQLVRELSRDAVNTKTWRNSLANGIARMSTRGEVTRERPTRERTWIFSQYMSLTEEFQGSVEGRTFFLWASAFQEPQRRTVTVSGARTYLPSQYELELQRGIGLGLFIGSGLFLELLAKSHDILLKAQNAAPAGFCSAMWAFQADSLFNMSKVYMANAIRHTKRHLLAGGDASTNLKRLLQGGVPPTTEEVEAHESLLAVRVKKARMIATEDEWRGQLVREQLFGRAREEAFSTETA